MLKLLRDQKVGDFLRATEPVLLQQASLHSFLLSLSAKLSASGKDAALTVRGVDQKNQLAIAGLQTDPDRALIVSFSSEDTAKLFARALWNDARIRSLPGVNGPLPGADAFALEWQKQSGCHVETTLNLRLFELTRVIPPRAAPGLSRTATLADEDLLFTWITAFREEAVPHDPVPPEIEERKRIRDGIESGHYFLWEDTGKAVCLVGSTKETATERWIAPVYTPPPLRGKGYASALVAVASQWILDRGRKGMLFTDLANPTSNSIYQKVGYRPLGDFKHLIFK